MTIDKYLRSSLAFELLTKVTHMRQQTKDLNIFFSVVTMTIELNCHMMHPLEGSRSHAKIAAMPI